MLGILPAKRPLKFSIPSWHSMKRQSKFKHLSATKNSMLTIAVSFSSGFFWFQTIWVCQCLTKKPTPYVFTSTSGCDFVERPRLRGRFQSPPASCNKSAKMQSNPKRPRQHKIHLGVNPQIGGKPPKWMVKIMVPNPIKMDDLGSLILGNIHLDFEKRTLTNGWGWLRVIC